MATNTWENGYLDIAPHPGIQSLAKSLATEH